MVIHCENPRCDVAFDLDEYGATQMAAHMKGSHGITASVEDFLPIKEAIVQVEPKKAETADTYKMMPEVDEASKVEEKATQEVKKKK